MKKLIPQWLKGPLKSMRDYMRYLHYRGTARFCPVCEKSAKLFQPFGIKTRDDARCPNCHALERHRLLWLYVNRETDLFDGREKKVLHVAPEPCLEELLRDRLGASYLTADLFNESVDIKMDITQIDMPDESFDVIYCSHVLEHVDDDKKAMREFRRVLKSDGWAILLVPIIADKTFEDPSIVSAEDRLREYGQEDHVRRYGPDYIDRLRESGFTVTKSTPQDLFSTQEVQRYGLNPYAGEIYFCTH